jgi:hypothetical protein
MNTVKGTLTASETKFSRRVAGEKWKGGDKRARFKDELRNISRRRYGHIVNKNYCRNTQRIFKRNRKTPKRKNEIKMGQQVRTDVT